MLSVVLRRALLVAVLCALAPLARADDPPIVVVERTQGEPLRGRLLDLTGRKFRLQLADGSVVEVPERDVREVRFEAPAAPRRPELTFRTVHGAPTARIMTEPGGVVVAFEPSQHNEYVMPRVELWRRVGDGPWTKLRELPPGGPGLFEDTPPDPRAAYSYKVVSVGQADEESPVVQRYGLTVPDDQVRKESEVLGPVTPGPRTYVVPVAVFADGAALVVVHAWTGSFEDRTRTWQARAFRVAPGAFVGDAIDGRDFRAAVSLEAARVETKPGGAARLVLRLRRADGRVEEIDDRQTLPDAIEQTATARGIILATKGQPAPRDHQAEVRAALASQRPLTLNFPVDTPLGDVLPLLRDLTGVGVVASPRIDQDEARLQFSVRDVPQAELLELIFETVAVEARPWCGVLWLYPRGACEPWARPSAAGPAGALLERARVDLELSRLPLRDALDLLREQTGLNVVVSAAAQDLIESDSLTATITAHDLSLQDALTLIVDGTDQLHWHARGSVVQVLTRTERPTREVLLEQLQRDIATGNAGLVRAKVAIPSNNGAALDELVRAVLALGEAPGTLTAERLSRALRLEPAANGTWNVVGLAEAPEERAALDAPTAAQSWEVTVGRGEPTRFTAVALERREVVPVLDLRALPASDADLWIEPRAGLFGALCDGALGLDLRGSQAAIAEITTSLAQLLARPDEIEWKAQLSYTAPEEQRELIVRTRSGRLFHAHVRHGYFGSASTFRFTPLARSHSSSSPALRAPTEPADAGDLDRADAAADVRTVLVQGESLVSIDRGRSIRLPLPPESRLFDADLWINPTEADIRAVMRRDESAPGAALALLPGHSFDDPTVPSHPSWDDALPREAVRAGATFLVRTRTQTVYRVRADVRGDEVTLTIARAPGATAPPGGAPPPTEEPPRKRVH